MQNRWASVLCDGGGGAEDATLLAASPARPPCWRAARPSLRTLEAEAVDRRYGLPRAPAPWGPEDDLHAMASSAVDVAVLMTFLARCLLVLLAAPFATLAPATAAALRAAPPARVTLVTLWQLAPLEEMVSMAGPTAAMAARTIWVTDDERRRTTLRRDVRLGCGGTVGGSQWAVEGCCCAGDVARMKSGTVGLHGAGCVRWALSWPVEVPSWRPSLLCCLPRAPMTTAAMPPVSGRSSNVPNARGADAMRAYLDGDPAAVATWSGGLLSRAVGT